MKIVSIDVPELGNRSYIVHHGGEAIVIDPSRRSQQYIDKAAELGVEIKAVFETHIHNDYVTGGYALSKKMNVPYYISAQDKTNFEHQPIEDEQSVGVGKMRVTGIASPGHTHSHMSYLVECEGHEPALFSGGSLLYGAVGRPDLVSEESTEPLAKAQYDTAQHFIERLQPETRLYPTHGFGSFCAATETENVTVSTLADQQKTNHAFVADSKDAFVKELINGLDDYPSYYAYMAPANLSGPEDPDLTPPKQLDKQAVMRALHDGAAIVDMRSRKAFAQKHLRGTFNIELSNSLATYVGWLIAWESPLILIAESEDEVRTAQEQLSLIGREILAGQSNPDTALADQEKVASYKVDSFSGLTEALPQGDVTVLDVRRQSEWAQGHVEGSVNIPLHRLQDRLHELPSSSEIWVHCASGFRASIAASIISGAGHEVVLINDDFSNAEEASLTTNKGEQ